MKPLLPLILTVLLSAAAVFGQTVGSVVIDPGHGGFDYGIRAASGAEKDYALSISKELEILLREANKAAYLTRRTDRYTSFGERANVALKAKADAFISLHATESEGFAVYITRYPEGEKPAKERYSQNSRQMDFLEKSRELARAIAESLKAESGIKVTIREIPLQALNPVGAPAVLIETPLSGVNKGQAKYVAAAILKGVYMYEAGKGALAPSNSTTGPGVSPDESRMRAK